ncbi:hydroxyacid-oxoacid transhydrogenase [Thermodesulfobacteriota bacterium]
MEKDYAFQIGTSNVRFGQGATNEVGMDALDMGIKRAMVVTDPILSKMPFVENVLDALHKKKIEYTLYDRVRVEPTDTSFKKAIDFAKSEPFDGFIAIGGGSSIDTAKAANLYSTYPPNDFIDYVNAPIGKGLSVPGKIKPLIAIPTTAGTGSESTGIAVFDFEDTGTKTSIASEYLKPALGIIDPENTRSQPPMVAASTGMDILVNAIESLTVIPYNQQFLRTPPNRRPLYQGCNPLTDMWSLQILKMIAQNIVRAVEDPGDDEARSMMLMAVSIGKIGFGYAGCHLPHAMSYPVAGMVRDYQADGYPEEYLRPQIPHGIAVVVNAPAVVRYTAPACPEKHLQAAEVLGADISGIIDDDAGNLLADQLIELMKRFDLPNGLKSLGYNTDDIPKLVQGTLSQQRLVSMSSRKLERGDLERIFDAAMVCW